jgi:hypothetical protein
MTSYARRERRARRRAGGARGSGRQKEQDALHAAKMEVDMLAHVDEQKLEAGPKGCVDGVAKRVVAD